MAAGKFRDKATFRRQDKGALDPYGNPAGGAWPVYLADVPADLRETPGKEALAAGRLEARVTGTLRIRASASSPARSVTPADQVEVRGHTWKILAGPIDPDGHGRKLEFTIERGGLAQ